MKHILAVAALAATAFVAKAQTVPVTLSEWKIEMPSDTVKAGTVIFRIKNAGRVTHDFYVKGPGANKGSREISAGQETRFTVTLRPGTYEIYCPLAEMTHKMAGMSMTLVVTAATPAAAAKKPAP